MLPVAKVLPLARVKEVGARVTVPPEFVIVATPAFVIARAFVMLKIVLAPIARVEPPYIFKELGDNVKVPPVLVTVAMPVVTRRGPFKANKPEKAAVLPPIKPTGL